MSVVIARNPWTVVQSKRKKKRKQKGAGGRTMTEADGRAFIEMNKAKYGKFYYPMGFSGNSLTEAQFMAGVRKGSFTFASSFLDTLKDLGKNLYNVGKTAAVPIAKAVMNPTDPKAVYEAGKAAYSAANEVANGKGRSRKQRGGTTRTIRPSVIDPVNSYFKTRLTALKTMGKGRKLLRT